MYVSNGHAAFTGLFGRRPQAIARIHGSAEYPDINGSVWFYPSPAGVLTVAEVHGLPKSEGDCVGRIFGFHIHSGESCGGEGEEPFPMSGTHYDTDNCQHPYHVGDLPPLFSTDGYAFSAFATGRFSVEDIIGKTVIIHDSPDDFSSQPSGNAGKKIACGEIKG